MGRPAIVVDCACFGSADAAQVDRLARLLLRARREGQELRLVNASPGLLDLIAFCGLADLLLAEPQRQAEEREQASRVEEEGKLDDPPAG